MPPRKKTMNELPGLEMVEEQKPPKDPRQTKDTSAVGALLKLKTEAEKQIGAQFDSLIQEVNALEALKKKTQEELEFQARRHKQREEQENLTLLLAQRKKQAEFDEKLGKEKHEFEEVMAKKEEDVKLRQAALSGKENEYAELKRRVEAFPKELQNAIENARTQTSAELKKDFEIEKKLLVQKYESESKLSAQHLQSLQSLIKQYDKEIQSLKEEKTKAIEQVKELAVAVIRGKEKELPQTTA